MRRCRTCATLLLLLAVLLSVSLATATLAAASTYYTGVCFVDSQHGWFTGADSSLKIVVWATSDGGRTLRRQSAHMAAGGGMARLAFASRSTGLWSDDTGVRRTTDGGRSWTYAPQRNLGDPRDVAFANAKVVWASGAFGSAGSGGAICRSSDGGATWRAVKTVHAPDGNQFGSLSCPSAQDCYVLGSGSLYGLWATNDGGKHWGKRRLPGGAGWGGYGSVAFPNKLTGWLFGNNGAIAKTTDGGLTWHSQDSGTTQRLWPARFLDARIGFALGDGGAILRTTDGGSHWDLHETGASLGLDDIFFVDRLHGWAVGYGIRLATADGGDTWKEL